MVLVRCEVASRPRGAPRQEGIFANANWYNTQSLRACAARPYLQRTVDLREVGRYTVYRTLCGAVDRAAESVLL